MKFNQTNVRTIAIPAEKRSRAFPEHIEWDDTMPGFGVRVRHGGQTPHRTFVVQYKLGDKQRRINLGNVAKVNLEQARAEAKKIFGKVAANKDPANERVVTRKAAAHTMGAIIEAYLADKATRVKRRSLVEIKRHLNIHWKPLHGLALASVHRADVAEQTRVIAKSGGPVAANRSRASLSAFFVWAIGEGLCEANPVFGTNKQQENGPRERTLSDAEAAALFRACPDNDYGRIVQLLMLTGCRRDEIGCLQWSEIDLEARTITIPAVRTKNHNQHIVPLTDKALAILQAIPRRDRDYVFGKGRGGYSGWSKSKVILDAAAKLKDDWTLHDIRRTVRTGLGKLGVAPHVAEAVLNHLPAKLIRTYDRNKYLDEKRAALDTWANHIRVAIAQASGANVARLKSRA
jgi:integrase